MNNINKLKVGDVLSEISHYKVDSIQNSAGKLIHLEGNTVVNISLGYIKDHVQSGDEFEQEIIVGKEDKLWTAKQIDAIANIHDEQWCKDNNVEQGVLPKIGDVRLKGIRTIWENIYSPHVFTCCFKKQDTIKSAKKLKEETTLLADSFAEQIDKIKTAKKGVAEAAKQFIEELVKNPILPYEEGEERVLRGYKIQFESRDGKYACVDMDIPTTENNVRPVNINSLIYIIFNNVKYIVE
jgi:hypothetical protein